MTGRPRTEVACPRSSEEVRSGYNHAAHYPHYWGDPEDPNDHRFCWGTAPATGNEVTMGQFLLALGFDSDTVVADVTYAAGVAATRHGRHWDFTSTTDSNGNPWPDQPDVARCPSGAACFPFGCAGPIGCDCHCHALPHESSPEYSLDYVWARNRVIVRVACELSPQSALDLADGLRYFAERSAGGTS